MTKFKSKPRTSTKNKGRKFIGRSSFASNITKVTNPSMARGLKKELN